MSRKATFFLCLWIFLSLTLKVKVMDWPYRPPQMQGPQAEHPQVGLQLSFFRGIKCIAVGGVSLILFLIISLIVGWLKKTAEANRWGKIWR